ncbi:hypothetical protein [Funiculus sociatus]|uniref:hypothetical protein n=1 Tax=Funiculus sociatus TaxID=450527 RepID=UPI0019A8AB42|nr:hypothetical protein [Trichocoleus sp. FACHB-69]
MWVIPNFRYPGLVALQIGLAIPTLFVRRSHFPIILEILGDRLYCEQNFIYQFSGF